MSGEGPKLLDNKPKKSKLKASIAMAPSSSTGAAAPPPPPPAPPPLPHKESFVRRYRFLWPLLLVVNFTIGAYVLMRTTMKDKGTSESETPDGPTSSSSTSAAAIATITEKPVTLPIIEPVPPTPIPEDQQHELLKWMLEERRKIKPRDAEEKKRIDEEKAVLKEFIRAKSIPRL